MLDDKWDMLDVRTAAFMAQDAEVLGDGIRVKPLSGDGKVWRAGYYVRRMLRGPDEIPGNYSRVFQTAEGKEFEDPEECRRFCDLINARIIRLRMKGGYTVLNAAGWRSTVRPIPEGEERCPCCGDGFEPDYSDPTNPLDTCRECHNSFRIFEMCEIPEERWPGDIDTCQTQAFALIQERHLSSIEYYMCCLAPEDLDGELLPIFRPPDQMCEKCERRFPVGDRKPDDVPRLVLCPNCEEQQAERQLEPYPERIYPSADNN